ncbi:MAG TPA: MBL fold metallo-hydrolase [Solirubrobacterales bacterium]|nr:MBL fold metallo-hydrolase [Solirubrobacterales bacterium]
MARRGARITYLGHSTVLLEQEGVRVLTDPVLADRFLHLRRHSASVEAPAGPLDCVLISHVHHDHLHPASLRRLPAVTPVIAPAGGGRLVERSGIHRVHEVGAGETLELGELGIEAVPANHPRGRPPFGPDAEPLGYLIEVGSWRAYFAGDTDLFDEMSGFGDLDLALLPVWGWGTSIGEGHLDPRGAVEALRRLRPRFAIPIHWGTFLPVGTRRRNRRLLRDPGREFARLAAEASLPTEVRVLAPGASTVIGAADKRRGRE